ncbi:MAG: hypothetical protein G01um101470_124 [Parcubacteria group bacterium Gr01-1014_70]|nr:MAG: hypothetical protein G01um101470_124 [Parcubacteria group bacterium Gr01-1014_70]
MSNIECSTVFENEAIVFFSQKCYYVLIMKRLFGIAIMVIILATGGFFAWQKGWLGRSSAEEEITLREDLPLAFGAIKSVFGDYKGAESAWLYATEISPLQARSLMNLGDLYRNKFKDYKKAEWAYIAAIERNDASLDPVMLYREFASFYRNSYTEKKELAISVLEQGLQVGSEDNSELLALAGMWAWEDGDFSKAEYFYEQFLLQNPSQEEARKDLDRIRRKELPTQ